VNFVPGTRETFVLSLYKKAIGKDYKQLMFYVIPLDKFQETQVSWSLRLQDYKFVCGIASCYLICNFT